MASSSLLILLVFIVCVAFVCGSSIATIKQYHICQECKTIKRSSSFGGHLFVPDPKTNCTLDDAFYIRKGYANITTIDLLFNVIRRIYNETAPTCRTEFCECARSYEYHDYDDHRPMFSSDLVINQVKRIVMNFITKYRPYIDTDDQIKKFADKFGLVFPSVLIRVFREYDYSLSRIYVYNNKLPDDEFFYPWRMSQENQNLTLQLSCLMATYFNNRAAVITPTNAQFEARLGCDAINLLGKKPEFQYFYLVNQWATMYPTLNLAGQNLTALFDKLLNNAKNLPKSLTMYAELNLLSKGSSMILSGYKTEKLVTTFTNASNFTMCLFNSPTLRIDAVRMITNGSVGSFRSLNFTFYVDSGSAKPSTLTYNLAQNTAIAASQNGTIVKSNSGTNVYQVVGFDKFVEIFHINSSSLIVYYLGIDVKITSPIRFFDSATGGVMINGFGSSTIKNG